MLNTVILSEMPERFHVFFNEASIASTGRRGPVLIDVPLDVQQKQIDYVPVNEVSIRGYKPTVKGINLQIRKVVDVPAHAT